MVTLQVEMVAAPLFGAGGWRSRVRGIGNTLVHSVLIIYFKKYSYQIYPIDFGLN